MSVNKEVIANVNDVPVDYVKCENCCHNKGIIVGNVINCSFWNNNDFSISKNDFCSFWVEREVKKND
jgi:hypothetical protein